MPDHFLGVSEMATFSGATFGAWAITNGSRVFLSFYRKWLVLLASIIMVFLFTQWHLLEWQPMVQNVVLALVNSVLVAFAAVGLNETVARGGEAPKAVEHGFNKNWINSWF